MFKTLVGKEIIVELKNDLSIKGILQSVDQHLNFKLNNTTALDPEKFPHMVCSPFVFVICRVFSALRKELFHSRFRCPICSPASTGH